MNMPQDRYHAMREYGEGSVLLERTVRGLHDAELDFEPSGGGWSIREIVHHIVDGDDIWKLGIMMAIGSGQAEFSLGWYALQAQETWGDRWAYRQRSIGPSLFLLKAIRAHLLELLRSVPQAWNCAVMVRTQAGEIEHVSVGSVIQMQADHLLHHVERIRAILAEMRGAEHADLLRSHTV